MESLMIEIIKIIKSYKSLFGLFSRKDEICRTWEIS